MACIGDDNNFIISICVSLKCQLIRIVCYIRQPSWYMLIRALMIGAVKSNELNLNSQIVSHMIYFLILNESNQSEKNVKNIPSTVYIQSYNVPQLQMKIQVSVQDFQRVLFFLDLKNLAQQLARGVLRLSSKSSLHYGSMESSMI